MIHRRENVLRVARALGAVVLLLWLLIAFTPLPNLAARRAAAPDTIAAADAIVALGASIAHDGSLNEASMRRLVRAIELYADGIAPILILSGSKPNPDLDEAATRAALARRLGVDAAAIVTVRGRRTTRDEATAVAAVLRPTGARRVLIVTDWFHAPRARAVFQAEGLDARVAFTRDAPEVAHSPEERVSLAWGLARELAARAYYRLAGFL